MWRRRRTPNAQSASQRRYAAELGATPMTLPTGHLAMLQDPAGLAALIGHRPGSASGADARPERPSGT